MLIRDHFGGVDPLPSLRCGRRRSASSASPPASSSTVST
ncbi:hypothetical protein I553_5862 [Mycobacterium xenopi 4042]|uniref:Uncharacterized protein n=1 Tax=Mycobacterium xenopi 4042 TaxID=1299334 RepID=X7ZUD2_MYCXE|nr:hypothetical protein I553_5862 [Mycobacterium xenopi 4042]